MTEIQFGICVRLPFVRGYHSSPMPRIGCYQNVTRFRDSTLARPAKDSIPTALSDVATSGLERGNSDPLSFLLNLTMTEMGKDVCRPPGRFASLFTTATHG